MANSKKKSIERDQVRKLVHQEMIMEGVPEIEDILFNEDDLIDNGLEDEDFWDENDLTN